MEENKTNLPQEEIPAPSAPQMPQGSEKRPEWYGKKKKKVAKDVVRLVLIIAAIALVVLLVVHRIGVKFCVTAELGSGRPDASVYFTKPDTPATYKWGEEVSLTEEGFYIEVVESPRWLNIVFLKVKDTIAPTAEDAAVTITSQDVIKPEEAVKNISDASEYTCEWVDEPMFGSAGTILTTVRITDSYGNSADIPVSIIAFEPKPEITWPLGAATRPDAQEFLDVTGHQAAFVTDLDTIDWDTMGTYEVTLSIDSFIYTSKISIVDGEPPVFTMKNLVVLKNAELTPEDFIESCEDASGVTYSFVVEPDTSMIGVTNIGVVASDAAGNSAEERAELTVVDGMITIEASHTGITQNDLLKILGYPVEEPEEEETEETAEETAAPTETEESEEEEEEEVVIEYLFVPDTLGNFFYTASTPDGNKYLYCTVQDTKAPVAETQDVEGYIGYELAPEAFLASYEDATEVTITYANTPNWNKEGEVTGTVQLTDSVGNTSTFNVKATLVPDTEAPVIYAAIDRNCYVGEAVAYLKEVFAEDNADTDIEVTVDKSQVNSRQEGDYPVTYTATDRAGNSTSVTVTYHFIEQTVTDEMIEEMVLDIFSQIFTEDMNVVEQARAIYDYVFNQIYYTGWADHEDWKGEAYRGYSEGVGDCYTYYSLTYVLLSHINCEVMSVERINGVEGHEVHFWCLVNLGTGWYHFDTINVAPDDVQCFMWTQEQCNEHSNHFWIYDTSLYPELETEPFEY